MNPNPSVKDVVACGQAFTILARYTGVVVVDVGRRTGPDVQMVRRRRSCRIEDGGTTVAVMRESVCVYLCTLIELESLCHK